jgi:hypothetical protein
MRSPTYKSLLACLVFSLSTACVYVPPVWDAGDEIHDVDQIRESVTTKAEVLALLGEPDFENRHDREFKYEGQSSAGFAIIVNRGGLVNPKSWSICISFDEYDVVRYVDVPCGSREAQERLAQLRAMCEPPLEEAIQLDAETQLRRVNECSELVSSLPVIWRWRCLAANQGNDRAQNHLGHYYRVGSAPIQQDFVEAYKWYSLAVANGNERAAELRHDVSGTMTPIQMTEAGRLVAEWEPNPAECEIKSDESNAP